MKAPIPATLALAMLLGGCASRPPLPPVSPEPRASASAAPGALLKELGFRNGPEKLSLPTETRLVSGIDQPNVVTLFADKPSPEEFAAHLRSALPRAGFTVSSDKETTLIFRGEVWEGSLTNNGPSIALTIRRR